MTLHRWPYKAKNCEIHDPKSLKNKLDGPWVAFLAKKGRGVATVVCVSHGYRSKFPSTHSNTHTTMATPLPFSVEIAVCSRYETLIWATFIILYRG